MSRLWSLVVVATLSACATSYQSSSLSGGFTDSHIDEDVYRVRFAANGYATRETAQTYWLYRAAELTLEKGFDGFEILSPMALGRAPLAPTVETVAFIFIPMPSNESRKPLFEGDIRLFNGPVAPNPPKTFDARVLKAALEPYVKDEKKCSGGNVCPHIKRYLQPPADAAPALPPKKTA